ncbi:helix-turn-helix domain-containing protein [Rhizobium paknamense]|uniref:Transcriptional regulator with XRE-family HTH domain n=1 Tax=Rhizobium paknamense TaxID=1206817 RepID=A0ABU0IIG7_9HYPH|nr:helix-turn-helix transcriptional regulator [Rhizobium paknamense]MDQ0458056.1 transcriptional regulator with XRE-family HTH domain [Rhizobium paknamense]
MKTISNRLKYALKYKDIGKLYALAVDLGVDISSISKWTNNGSISLQNAIKISDYLDISLDWLLLGRGHIEQHKIGGYAIETRKILQACEKLSEDSLKKLEDFLTSL